MNVMCPVIIYSRDHVDRSCWLVKWFTPLFLSSLPSRSCAVVTLINHSGAFTCSANSASFGHPSVLSTVVVASPAQLSTPELRQKLWVQLQCRIRPLWHMGACLNSGNVRESVDGVRAAQSTAECDRFGLPARPRPFFFSRMFSLTAVVCAPYLTRAQILVQAPGLDRWQCELRLGVTFGQGMEMETDF